MNQDYIKAANISLKLPSDHLSVKHLFMSAPPNKKSLNSDFSHLWSLWQCFLSISELFLNYRNLLMHNEMWVQMVWVHVEQMSTLHMYNTWNLKQNSQRLFPMLFVVVVLLLSVSPFPAGFAGRPTEIELQMRWLQNVWSNAECVVKHSINHAIGHVVVPCAAHTHTSTTCGCHQIKTMTNIAKDTIDQAFGAFT